MVRLGNHRAIRTLGVNMILTGTVRSHPNDLDHRQFDGLIDLLFDMGMTAWSRQGAILGEAGRKLMEGHAESLGFYR